MKYGDKYTATKKNIMTGEILHHTATYRYTNWNGYYTNNEGDGLWSNVRQILGTCDFTVRGCSTEKTAKAKIRKYVKGE